MRGQQKACRNGIDLALVSAEGEVDWGKTAILSHTISSTGIAKPMPALPPLDCILVSPGACASQALLAELGRMLAPEGVLVLCLPKGDI